MRIIQTNNTDEILVDPALRQAYDNFGHSAVAVVRHNGYGEDSLYLNLIKLHDMMESHRRHWKYFRLC